jgi:hypothetical protein
LDYTFKKDARDRIEVFLYTNLAIITSPHPEVLLTSSVRSALIADINYLPGIFGFPPDLQQILNAFILTNIDQVSVSARLLAETHAPGSTSTVTPVTGTGS